MFAGGGREPLLPARPRPGSHFPESSILELFTSGSLVSGSDDFVGPLHGFNVETGQYFLTHAQALGVAHAGSPRTGSPRTFFKASDQRKRE